MAKVHTWLKTGSYSDLGQLQSVSLENHAHSQGHTSLNVRSSPHVRFADEEACADDTKSIGSSHTSGIVTDYPISPKLLPNCCCQKCSPHEKGKSPAPGRHCHMGHDGLSMPSGPSEDSTATNTIELSSSESTLCLPLSISSCMTSTPPTARSNAENAYTGPTPALQTTNQNRRYSSSTRRLPLANRGGKEVTSSRSFKVGHSLSHLSHHSVGAHPSSVGEEVKGRRGVLSSSKRNHRCPEAPENVCVSLIGKRGEALEISWRPVK